MPLSKYRVHNHENGMEPSFGVRVVNPFIFGVVSDDYTSGMPRLVMLSFLDHNSQSMLVCHSLKMDLS